MKILIIEDDPIIAVDIKSFLQSEGLTVYGIAKNASTAYDLLAHGQANFILLDIYLGTGDSGIDIARHIHEAHHIPFVFLTSFSDDTTLSAAEQYAPYGYIVKPFQEPTLLTTIRIAWSNYQKRSAYKSLGFTDLYDKLTPKEKEIVQLLLDGGSYDHIVAVLDISINTLKYHVKNIYTKLDLSGRAELYKALLKT